MERVKPRGQNKNHTLWNKPIGFISVAVFILYLSLCEILLAAGPIYVNVNSAAITPDGLSWAKAFKTVQEGIDMAFTMSPCEVWVAKGSYYIYISDPINDTVQLRANVDVYGGFDGTEISREQRDFEYNITILDGHKNVIDPNRVYHVVTGSNNAMLDGFTVTGGRAAGSSPHNIGGGMYNSNSSPTIINCIFTGNSGFNGGGIYNTINSSPTIINCTLEENSANSSNGIGGGIYNIVNSSPTLINSSFIGNSANSAGGMYCSSGCFPIITNCIFTGNSAQKGGAMLTTGSPTLTNCNLSGNVASEGGGGIYNGTNSSPAIDNCTFTGNSASSYGGGIYSTVNASPTINNCTFIGNSSNAGGGIGNARTSSYQITNSIFIGNTADAIGGGIRNAESSPTIINCTFEGNLASLWGGGIYNNSDSHPILTNCTFAKNIGDNKGGGIYNHDSSTSTVKSCILWGDSPQEIFNDPNASSTVTYSNIQGGHIGAGNINNDPKFADPNSDLHLQISSPCIDAADGNVDPTNDIEGNSRYDYPAISNTGIGDPNYVDMGAYESQLPIITDAEDEGYYNGEAGVVITGIYFGLTQGIVELNTQANGGGSSQEQTITKWSNLSVTITINQGGLPDGTLYLIVTDNNANFSNGWAVTLGPRPIITDADDERFYHSESGITISGANFQAVQGNGWVELNNQQNGSGTSVNQLISSWDATSISIGIKKGGLSDGTNYLIIHNNDAIESDGYTITLFTFPVITDAGDEDFYDGEAEVIIIGTNFGAIQGGGTVKLNTQSDGSGSSQEQTVIDWSDTSIKISINQGALSDGTLYLIVMNDAGDPSNGWEVTLFSAPVITDAEDEDFYSGETGVVVTGSNFGVTEGTIELNTQSNGSAARKAQTVSNWSDTSITINISLGSLPQGTLFLIVNADGGERKSNGWPVCVWSKKKEETIKEDRPTAINLTYFAARGEDALVLIEWQTAQEISNMGFFLYRGNSPGGPFIKLTNKLIPGLNFSFKAKKYLYKDRDVTQGKLYYYKIEDIDIWSVRTLHGPICVDWDGYNLPVDRKIIDNLDHCTDNSGLNMDNDGLKNLAEYAMSTNLFNPDTDENGILDEEEDKKMKQNKGGNILPHHRTTIEITDMADSTKLLKKSFSIPAMHKAVCPPITPASPFFFKAAYKILICEEGIYRLTRNEFENYGIRVDAMDLSKVRLFNLGEEVAIYVYDKDGDNQLDCSDYIQFFGQSVPDRFKKYDKNNVYWFTIGASIDNPRRMEIIDGTPKDGKIPKTFTGRNHYEEDEYYLETMPGEDDEDRWLFSPFALGRTVDLSRAGDPVSFTFQTMNIARKGSLTISLYGTCNLEHDVEIFLNNTSLGTYSFSGITSYQTHIKGVDLCEGPNILTIKCIREIDSIGLDWFEVEYPKAFVANDNQLTFYHDTGYRYLITGFSDNEIQVFDITTHEDVACIANVMVAGSEHYAIDFEPRYGPYMSGKKRYLILTQEAMKKPLSISEKCEFSLKEKVIGMHYIIITRRILGWDKNGNIHTWLDDLYTLRKSQGLKPIVIDLADIYDEFSHGIHTPQAVKDFLIFAYNNKQDSSYQYVMLLGDSSYDYTNNWDLDEEEKYPYVPTYLITTPYKGESASDEWFVRTDDGNPIPDLCIGRLPAASTEQAEVMVKKILTYEKTANTKSWEKNVLLVADNITKAYETAFESINDEVASLIPPGMNTPFKSYLNDYTSPEDCAADIKAKINGGCLMVNYNGHGWGQIFAKEAIFTNDDIASLTNKEKLAFFVSMTCMAGYFINPESLDFTCMAEALLRAEEKGAIAALMPTAMSTPQEQQIINSALFYTIFIEDIRALGPAIARAKQIFLAKGKDPERLCETFLLFGDPAMKLKIPFPRRPMGVISQGQDGCTTLSWQETKDCHGEIVAGYNLYRSPAPSNKYYRVNSSLITETCYKDQSTKKDIMYRYVVTSVDTDGYESVPSQYVTARPTALEDDRMLNTTSGKLGNAISSKKYKPIASTSARVAEPLNSEHDSIGNITDIDLAGDMQKDDGPLRNKSPLSRSGCFIFTVSSFSSLN